MPEPISIPAAGAPLRIGIVVPYDLAPHAGGVRQHTLHLKRALERRGDEVALIGPTSAPHRPPSEGGIFALPGVVTVPVNGTQSAVGMLVSPRRLLRLCRALALDVVHLHEPQVPTMAWSVAWGLRGVPKVATFHAADESDSIVWLRRISGAMVYRWLDRAIAVSAAAERRTKQTWSRPLVRIPNGVCTDLFRPRTSSRAPGPFRFLSVGALADRRKGSRPLLEAFARLRAQGVEAELTMVGAQRRFRLGTLPPGVILREGLTDQELAEAFRHADALVAPALGQESFGMILLEAMACGKPIVSSDIEGYREVARAEGTRFVAPGDVAELAAAMAELVGLSPSTLRAMGAGNVVAARAFAWPRVAEAVRQQYTLAVAARARAPRAARPGLAPAATSAMLRGPPPP